MSARRPIFNHLVAPLIGGPVMHDDAKAMLDAYRTEVLAEAKVETVAWLVKKAAERPTWDAGVLASKVDRGAVRAFIGTEHYRDAMDAHRAEVLREAGAIADELIAGLDRTGDPDSFVKADAFRAYSDRLHEIADGGTQAPAGESTQPAPDFFQPGTTYENRRWMFHCLAVAPSPTTGLRTALGYLTRVDGTCTVHGLDQDDWERAGWTVRPEGGEAR